MAYYATFPKDRNWEGYIRIEYEVTQNAAENTSFVEITDVQFQSIEGRTATWTAYGEIVFSNADDSLEYYGDIFSTYGSGWVTLGGWSPYLTFTVDHDDFRSGTAPYFNVVLHPVGNYSDFNVFHPRGGSYNCEYSQGTGIRVTLPTIDRSPANLTLITTTSANGSVTLNATADASCCAWQYCKDNSGSWTTFYSGTSTSASITIPGMTGTHSFQVRATKVSNDVVGYSGTVSTSYPQLSFSANSVTSDSSITLNWSSLLVGESVTLYLKYGSTQLWTSTFTATASSGSTTFNAAALKQMFEDSGITVLSSITIQASMYYYTAATASFTLAAGNNMCPSADFVITIAQQGKAATYFPNTYIAGISKFNVSATVTPGSSAGISTVKCGYGTEEFNLTLNPGTGKYEGTAPAAVTANNMPVMVAVTDVRGMNYRVYNYLTGVKTYTAPGLVIDRSLTYRCDSNGNQLDGGLYLRVKADATYDTGLTGNDLTLTFMVLADRQSHTLTNGVQSATFGMINPTADDPVTVQVTAEDKVSSAVVRQIILAAQHKDVVAMRDGNCTAVGIGVAPEKRTVHNRKTVTETPMPGTVDLPTPGGVFLGGVNLLDFGLHADASEGSTSAILNRDVLTIDEENPWSEKNQTFDVWHGGAGDARYPAWTNMPSQLSTCNEFNAMRTVVMSKYYVMVVMFEFWPTAGRIWINSKWKDTGNTTYNWRGWKYYTPST